MLLADAASDLTPSGLIGGMVGAAGGIGFAVWYGWFVTTRTIPGLVKDFKDERVIDRQERRAERDEFKSALKQVVEAVQAVPCQVRADQILESQAWNGHHGSSVPVAHGG